MSVPDLFLFEVHVGTMGKTSNTRGTSCNMTNRPSYTVKHAKMFVSFDNESVDQCLVQTDPTDVLGVIGVFFWLCGRFLKHVRSTCEARDKARENILKDYLTIYIPKDYRYKCHRKKTI